MKKSSKETESKSTARRTEVKDMPKPEKELTKEEQKKIKGGDWLMSPAGNAK